MARKMKGPSLAELMQARSTGDYATSTPANLTDEQIAQMQAEVQATGKPPAPQPVQIAPGQAPTPQQQEALWGRGAPVGQSSHPDVFGPTQAPAATQDEVLSGLALKANAADPRSKTYLAFPAAVVDKFGIPGADLADLSVGERLALRRMGVQFPAPKATRRAAVPAPAEDQRFNNLKAMYGGGGSVSPYYQNAEVQDYYRANGAPPLLRTSPEAKKIQKFIPPVEGSFDINDNVIYGRPR